MEAEVGHLRHGDEVDPEVEGEHGEDLVAVDHGSLRVDGEQAVAVAVEGHSEVEVAAGDRP